MSREVKPFRIAVGDDVLDDLKSRLRKTRWPEAAPVDDWSQGVPLQVDRGGLPLLGRATTIGAAGKRCSIASRNSPPRSTG